MHTGQLLETAIHAAVKAGMEIMEVYQQPVEVEWKEDRSPLTLADKSAHKKIMEHLAGTGLPVLSEEGKHLPYEERKNWDLFWLVDPLDGTKEFIKRNGEFTVNIALIEKGIPRAGVVFAPALNILYFGSRETGSFKTVMDLNNSTGISLHELVKRSVKLPEKKSGRPFTVVASRSHLTPETEQFVDALKRNHGEIKFISKGSSLKICLVADGSADVYPRLAPTMEWDTAAGHAVARFAGFDVIDFKRQSEMHYNKENLLNEWFVVQPPASG